MKKTILVLTVMALVLTSAFAATTAQQYISSTFAPSNGTPVMTDKKQSIDVTAEVETTFPKYQLMVQTPGSTTWSGNDVAANATTKNALATTAGLTVNFRVDRSAYRLDESKTVTIGVTVGNMTGKDYDSVISGALVAEGKVLSESLTAGAAAENVMHFSVKWAPADADAAALVRADEYSATVTVTYTIS